MPGNVITSNFHSQYLFLKKTCLQDEFDSEGDSAWIKLESVKQTNFFGKTKILSKDWENTANFVKGSRE